MNPNRKRVIVVDDCRVTLLFAKRALQAAGYDVMTTDNPILLTSMIREERPDLVLVDVFIPLIDGDEAVGILRRGSRVGGAAAGSQPLLVLYSSLAEDELERRAAGCGADGFIKKSEDASGLARAVKGFLARQPVP